MRQIPELVCLLSSGGSKDRAEFRKWILWRQESAEAFLQLSPAVVKLQRRWCALISAGTVRLAAVLESEGVCMWQVWKPNQERDKGGKPLQE